VLIVFVFCSVALYGILLREQNFQSSPLYPQYKLIVTLTSLLFSLLLSVVLVNILPSIGSYSLAIIIVVVGTYVASRPFMTVY